MLNVNYYIYFLFFKYKRTVYMIRPNVLTLYTMFSLSIHNTTFNFVLTISLSALLMANAFHTRTNCALCHIKINIHFCYFCLFLSLLVVFSLVYNISVYWDIFLYFCKFSKVLRHGLDVLSALKGFLRNLLSLFNNILSQSHTNRCPISSFNIVSKLFKVLIPKLKENLSCLVILRVFKDSAVIKFQKFLNLKFSLFNCVLSKRLLTIAKSAHYNKSIDSICSKHILNLLVNKFKTTCESVITSFINHQHIV